MSSNQDLPGTLPASLGLGFCLGSASLEFCLGPCLLVWGSSPVRHTKAGGAAVEHLVRLRLRVKIRARARARCRARVRVGR